MLVMEISNKVFIIQPMLSKVPTLKFLDLNIQDTQFLELQLDSYVEIVVGLDEE